MPRGAAEDFAGDLGREIGRGHRAAGILPEAPGGAAVALRQDFEDRGIGQAGRARRRPTSAAAASGRCRARSAPRRSAASPRGRARSRRRRRRASAATRARGRDSSAPASSSTAASVTSITLSSGREPALCLDCHAMRNARRKMDSHARPGLSRLHLFTPSRRRPGPAPQSLELLPSGSRPPLG